MRNPYLFILALFASFALLVGFGGCDTIPRGSTVQEQRDEAVRRVAANLSPIGDSLEMTGRPAEGSAVNSQVDVLRAMAPLLPEGKAEPAPVASLEEWLEVKGSARNAQLMAKRYADDAASAKQKIEEMEAENGSWWAWLKDGSAIAGTLAAAAAVYRGLNLPGGQLVDLGVKLAFPHGFAKLQSNVNALAQKNEVLVTTVGGSDVGREALAALDTKIGQMPPEVQAAISGVLSASTGGQAESLQDFFKTFAKAYAVDAGQAPAVAKALSEIRSDNDTVGGRSTAFTDIASAMAKGLHG